MKITVAVTCVGITLGNGEVRYNSSEVSVARYPVGTVATLECDRGYTLSVSTSRRTCQISASQISGTWNQHTPTCNQGKACNTLV